MDKTLALLTLLCLCGTDETLTISSSLRFDSGGDDLDDPLIYEAIVEDVNATLFPAYAKTPGFRQINVTNLRYPNRFQANKIKRSLTHQNSSYKTRNRRVVTETRDTASTQKPNEQTNIVADYEAIYGLLEVVKYFNDTDELLERILDEVISVVKNSSVGNRTVDPQYIEDVVERELEKERERLKDEVSNLCDTSQRCNPCYKCSSAGLHISCNIRCNYGDHRLCDQVDEQFVGCKCTDLYLPIVLMTSCVHQTVIIASAASVAAFILVLSIAVITVRVTKKRHAKKLSVDLYSNSLEDITGSLSRPGSGRRRNNLWTDSLYRVGVDNSAFNQPEIGIHPYATSSFVDYDGDTSDNYPVYYDRELENAAADFIPNLDNIDTESEIQLPRIHLRTSSS